MCYLFLCQLSSASSFPALQTSAFEQIGSLILYLLSDLKLLQCPLSVGLLNVMLAKEL